MLILKQRQYPLSYLLGITELSYYIAQFLSVEYNHIFNTLAFILILIKAKQEGFRFNIFILVLARITTLLSNIFGIIFTLYFLYLAKNLIVYQLPDDGSSVGHIWIKNLTPHLPELTIYYPAANCQNQKIGAKWLKAKNYSQRMFDTSRKDQKKRAKIPHWIFWVLSSQFYKIKIWVYENSDIDTKRARKNKDSYEYPAIIISHGLASHCDGYSTLARKLAQEGFLVFCPEHIEYIKNVYPTYEENRYFRRAQVYDRFKTIQSVLDLIYDKKWLQQIFKEKVQIEEKEVSIVGHSFGASTAIYSAFHDSRFTGACVAYDPCFYIYEDQMTDFNKDGLKIPVLCIMADDFYSRLYPYMENDSKLLYFYQNIKKPIIDQSLYLYIAKQQHADFSDLTIIWNGEARQYGVSKDVEEIHIRYGMIFLLTILFLKNSIEFHESRTQSSKSQSQLKEYLLNQIEQQFGKKFKDSIRFSSK